MNEHRSTGFWLQAALTLASGSLLMLTVLWKDWIEALFGVDPDQYSGWVEWLIVAILLVLTATFGLLAHSEWRRRAATAG